MTNSIHSSCPWTISGYTIVDNQGLAVAYVNEQPIATYDEFNQKYNDDLAIANVNLIAAAPDLLEALRMIADCGLRPECIAVAEKALAKVGY